MLIQKYSKTMLHSYYSLFIGICYLKKIKYLKMFLFSSGLGPYNISVIQLFLENRYSIGNR